ncbi:wall-associated receptor kinase-like 10 [Abrus precatorius]|uniref:Wall-associated receptor kinase-like 10 n=1 Tax=Abrus precatorius TaxID=3816 RepID=A0A8B8JTT3_ABRPR|nr:wall-associated receptor kinase-like 10 [Abrus precatorius]
MLLKYVFCIIILMIGPIHPLASAQYSNTTEPDCDSRCGTVTIPYPFGIKDPKCYADKWFEIECRSTSTGQTPYLKSPNVEVTSIDPMNSKVWIMNPVFHWNCQNTKDSEPVIDLKGTPFVYSKDDNKFTAIGCNKIAFLQSNGSEVSGCVSLCDRYDDEEVNNNVAFGVDGCVGRFCCETSLPSFLSEFNVTLENVREKNVSDGCSHALIGTEYWYRVPFGSSYEDRSFRDLGVNYVPAVLDWVVLNSSLKRPTEGANCTNVASSQNRPEGWRCECYTGFYGNPYITGSCIAIDGSSDSKTRAKWAIVGVSSSLGSFIILLGIWWLYKVLRKRMIQKRKEKFFKQNGGLLLQQRMSSTEVRVEKVKLFSLNDLEKATDHFNTNRIIGKGGQGTVYKGMLVDGQIIAVKKFKVEGKVEEFVNEFVILSQINHRNVVKLLGCCLEAEIPLLVYEFIPNGNLSKYLHDQSEDLALTWDMRLRIATEIAGALFYLHSVASQPIYHRDIKSTNILLDEKYRAKVADFGTSRIISTEATHLTTVVQGTFGYLDPEYFHTSQFTEKSDVYSFGVVLVELLTGERAISSVRSHEAKSLVSYFNISMEKNCLFDIIDKKVMKEGKKEHIIAVANLANRCLELNGKKRPTMKEVTFELEGIRKLDKKSSVEQNHEEIELAGVEDYQNWTGYSTSNSFPTLGSVSDSEVIPIVTLK